MRSITTPRLLIFGCATLSALLLGIAAASAETTLEKIKRTGVMTSANTFSYPPFGFIEDGKQVGFDVDLGNEIARRMGVKLTFEAIDFRGIIAALTSGRVDLLITGMVYTPDRAQRIDFSEPCRILTAGLPRLSGRTGRAASLTISSASASGSR
jgi:ABC-type amino acid transport substrate-binding protein